MKALCQLSGGLDSIAATLVALLDPQVTQVRGLFVDLSQPYVKEELEAVRHANAVFAKRFPKKWHGYDEIPTRMRMSGVEGTPSEYIPVRNLVIGAISANVGLSYGMDEVVVGSKTFMKRPDDPYSFSDCTQFFYDQLGDLATVASEGKALQFRMPLVGWSKRKVIDFLIQVGYEPRWCWSCYHPTPEGRHCGECYHCEEIKKAGAWHHFA